MGKSIQTLSCVTRVGLDLAKRVFQIHAIDAKGEIVVARKLTRSQLISFFAELPPCVVGMEACRSAHHWGRGHRHVERRLGRKEATFLARED
jgi:transposase